MSELELVKRDKSVLLQQQKESIALLKELDKEVGLVAGEKIAKHIARLTGTRFNEKDFDMSDLNGEQAR
jgi:hypothetical protein